MNQKKLLSETLNRNFSKWRNINKHVDRVLLGILLFMIAFVGSALMDNWMFLERGIDSVKYHNFDELLAINPDTVAWLTIDGTHIDNPVVQGKDNFEYLDKEFDGDYYTGGTLFLDYMNSHDLSDRYNIIHGHNMAAGAMFGDLEKFLDKDFFTNNFSGKLLTPTYDYDLRLIAVGEFDAYDRSVYTVGDQIPFDNIKNKTHYKRTLEIDDAKQVLALSTCSSDLTDNRVVLFCKMENKTKHK